MTSHFLFLCNCGGGRLWRTIIRTGTDMDVHCSHSAMLTARSSRLHSAILQCISVHRVSQVHVSPLYGDGREGALYEMEKKPFVRCGGDAVALSGQTPTR